MSELAERLEEYLALRRSLGYKLERVAQVLADFVAHLDAAGRSHISTEFVLSWAIDTTNPESSWRAQRLGLVRGFARYLHTVDPRHEVPPTGLVPRRRGRLVPYLFSAADIEALMRAAVGLRSPFQAHTIQTLIGLLAVTGLRVGEAIRLNRTDIDFEAGIITVRDSKGNKSRHVPISLSTRDALHSYLTDWGCYFPDAKAALTTTTGTRVRSSNLGTLFAEVVSLAGLGVNPQGALPRLRGLRHSFAVSALALPYGSTGRVLGSTLAASPDDSWPLRMASRMLSSRSTSGSGPASPATKRQPRRLRRPPALSRRHFPGRAAAPPAAAIARKRKDPPGVPGAGARFPWPLLLSGPQ